MEHLREATVVGNDAARVTGRGRRPLRVLLARATLGSVLLAVPAAHAFQGPYGSIVEGDGGFMLDVDVRWPDGGPPPAGGWPVVFWAHGAGGDKTSLAGAAGQYADDGYVTLTWTNRLVSVSSTPNVFAADLVALKTWLVNDFASEAAVTVPIDSSRFGITGGSLGGYTSWSGGLLTEAFATIVPFNWGFHGFVEHMTSNGSIERTTAGDFAASLPDEYDAASLQSGFEAVFSSAIAAFPSVAIPVMSQIAMLDGRTGGTYSLHDHLALTAAPSRLVYLGTGGHQTPGSDDAFRDDLRDRWFAFHLKSEATGIDAELPIQMALLVTNEHLAFPSWPPVGQDTATVYLRDAGRLLPAAPADTEPADTLVNDPGSFTWFDAAPSFNVATMRANLPKQTISYETPALNVEVLLIGEPAVELHVAGTGSRYQVNVHLYDQPDGGDQIFLAWGTATLDTTPAVAAVTLSLTGRRIPAGHRLRLEITNRDDEDLNHADGFEPGAGWLRYIPFFELSTTQVFHDGTRPSSLTLPLIGRSALPLPGASCAAAPRGGCRLPAQPGSSSLTVKDSVDDADDALTWNWKKGSATGFTDLADPVTTYDYTFCLYQGTAAALVLEARAPAADLCGTKPCWKQLGSLTSPTGFRYVDKERTPDGLRKLHVKAGEALKAKALVKGKGGNLGASGHFPTLPLALPVVAQLQTTDTCWEVTYGAAQVNTLELFRAK